MLLCCYKNNFDLTVPILSTSVFAIPLLPSSDTRSLRSLLSGVVARDKLTCFTISGRRISSPQSSTPRGRSHCRPASRYLLEFLQFYMLVFIWWRLAATELTAQSSMRPEDDHNLPWPRDWLLPNSLASSSGGRGPDAAKLTAQHDSVKLSVARVFLSLLSLHFVDVGSLVRLSWVRLSVRVTTDYSSMH